MKNFYKAGATLLAILSLSMGVSAKDVAVKWSGPAGMGDLIYYSPLTGLTNMVMGSNGVEVRNINGPIGGTTPAAGTFTTLASSGAYTLGIGGTYTGVFNIVGTSLTFVVNGSITNVLDADITSP